MGSTAEIAAGFVVAFAFSVLLGGPVIRLLKRLGAQQTVSADAPSRHAEKQGTTTMGGLLIMAGLAFPVLIDVAYRPNHRSALALLGLTIAYGLIGFLDDYLIATRGKNLGLKARQKLVLQFAFAIGFMLWLRATAVPGRTTVLNLGPLGAPDLGVWYYILGTLFVVAMSNAINLTDGLDGLAAGVSAILAVALACTMAATAGYGWLPLFGVAVAGGCAGFLWFNIHPAQVFMGDTGSLALGAALAGMALLGKVEAPFQTYALVPWAETFSVIVQVLVFKLRKSKHGLEYAKANRVFRRTPLHHHFEETGWRETKIVGRFWLATALAVAGTIALTGGR
jgi:phospho-N-acetylmuramoyl-pentapeptide-transferase